MPKSDRKSPNSEELARLDVEHDPQARITYQLVRQLESYLPIASFEKITEVRRSRTNWAKLLWTTIDCC
jgi:hypothetical protein